MDGDDFNLILDVCRHDFFVHTTSLTLQAPPTSYASFSSRGLQAPREKKDS